MILQKVSKHVYHPIYIIPDSIFHWNGSFSLFIFNPYPANVENMASS